MAYNCQYHDGPGQASLLLTDLASGQTLSTCPDDAPVMLAGALAAYLNVDVAKLWGTIERWAKKNQLEPPAPPEQDQGAVAETVAITCPFCEQVMEVLATDADLAKESHLAKCEVFKAAQESEQS